MTITMLNAPPPSGIGRRRGAASRKKSPVTSIIVAAVSFLVTLFLILAFGSYNFSSSTSTTNSNGKIRLNDAKPIVSSDTDDGDDDTDEAISEEFQDIAGIARAKLHLVSIDAEHMSKSGSNGYHGVTGSFCKLDWKKYKKDPPSLPMFRMLVRWKELVYMLKALISSLLMNSFWFVPRFRNLGVTTGKISSPWI